MISLITEDIDEHIGKIKHLKKLRPMQKKNTKKQKPNTIKEETIPSNINNRKDTLKAWRDNNNRKMLGIDSV